MQPAAWLQAHRQTPGRPVLDTGKACMQLALWGGRGRTGAQQLPELVCLLLL